MALQPAVPIDANYTRMTMRFTAPRKTWTEVHWLSRLVEDAKDNLFDAKLIATTRAQLLATDVSLTDVRCSNEKTYRDAASVDTIIRPTRVIDGTQRTENLSEDCVELRYESGSQYRRVMWLGGVPDVMFSGDGYDKNGSAAWDTAVQQYMNWTSGTFPALLSKLGFLALNKAADVAPECDIATVTTVAGSTAVVIETLQAPLIARGSVVRIRNYPAATPALPLNQMFTVIAVDGLTFTVNVPLPATVSKVWGGGGKVRKQVKTFKPYLSCSWNGVRPRKRGNRSGQPLGRSKRKRTVGY